MLDYGAEQLVLKLEQLFQGKEELISSGRLRICLTATVIVFLNKCFKDTQQHTNSQNRILEYLKQCIKSVHTLKVVQGPTYKFNDVIDLSNFQDLKVLEIDKIAIGYISGLKNLRSQIKNLKCCHGVDKIHDIITLCGHDLSSAFAWPYLEIADFSFNTIRSLDSSLRFLTSLQCLNLSHNELTNKTQDDDEQDEWMYLSDVRYLDLGYNLFTKVPNFPENCCSKITTLILQNNDLVSLEGVEALANLKTLDVSRNCISSFSSFTSLVRLHQLVSISCRGNPISYDERYRNTLVSCLSPSPRQLPVVVDDKELSARELYSLGQSMEVNLSSFLPARPYGTPEEKRKTRKSVIRQPSIRDIGDEHHKETSQTSSMNREEIEEESENIEKTKTDEDNLIESKVKVTKKNVRALPFSSSPEQQSASPKVAETLTDNYDSLQLPESPSFTRNEKDSPDVLNDVESGELFLVSLNNNDEVHPEFLFLCIKDHEILEKNVENGKITSRLDLNGLLDVNVISNDVNVGVRLKFSHVHKDRKYREYFFDNEGQCEKFLSLLKDFVQEPVNEDKPCEKFFKCLKCSKCFNTDEEISLCTNCGSSVVVEVMKDELEETKTQNKNEVSRNERDNPGTNPDLIPNTVGHAPIPPDICISDKDTKINEERSENTPELNSEYGALVSSIHLKLKEKETYEDSCNNDDYQAQVASQPLLQNQNSPSPAMNVSLDSLSSREYSYSNKIQESPMASSYSSQSGSETRNSTPVPGKKASMIHFYLDSCTHCDHRLKLYLETKLFRGEEGEQFCCMIKCPVASYGYKQGIPGLLVISNSTVYVCKITGIESTRPKEWLTLKACYHLTYLRYIECGLKRQSFRLEFSEESACHTFLVGDGKRCEDFLTNLRSVCKKACKDKHKPPRIGKANPQTLANIKHQVFGIKDENLLFKGRRLYEQAINFTDPPLLKDNKVWFRTLPQSMLGEEFIDWLINNKEASSYREAVHIGQLLLNAGAIQCFNKDGGFSENQYYYFDLSAQENEDEASKDNTTEPSKVNTKIKQYILGHIKDEEKLTPISIIITNTHIALAEENHQWPLPRKHAPPKLLSGPQFTLKKKQKIIDITDVELFADSSCEIEIEFRDEDTPGSIEDDRWFIVLQSENSLSDILDAVKEPWEEKFEIELPINIVNKMV